MRALIYAQSVPWAITGEAYASILEIAAREKLSSEETAAKFEALAARLGKPLTNTRETQLRSGVAIVPVTGPIFRYANCFGAISGGTSSEELAQDFTAALDNPAVRAIVLDINSPGGMVEGTNEFSKMLASARGAKPITAYVGGSAQSGAYWIASAADRIVIDETAMLGSIGVVMSGRGKKDDGSFEIVSSQSPYKRTDPATDEGRDEIRKVVDALAQVFIETVARNRGVDPAKVVSDFGQGRSLVGAASVAAGLADELGSLESVIAKLSADPAAGAVTYSFGGSAARGRTDMNTPATTPAAGPQPLTGDETKCPNCGKGMAAGAAAERARIAAIINHAESIGREQLARTLAFDTEMTSEAAGRILAVSPKTSSSPVNPLAAAMTQVPNPPLGPGSQSAADDVKSTAKAIAALANGK